MKRFFVVLGGLLMLPAFAEVAPVYYDEIVEYTDDMIDAIEDTDATDTSGAQQQNVSPRTTTNRSGSRTSAGSRNVATARANTAAAVRNAQRNATRGTVSRTTAKTSAQKTPQRANASRTSVVSRSGQSGNKATRARVGTGQASVMAATKASSPSYRSITTVGSNSGAIYLPNTQATVDTSRVSVTPRRSGAVSRMSMATTPIVTETDIATTTSNLDAIAELTEYCQAQYAACMDNYCNVLDDNQGRCSCSKNLKNYQKVEEALTAATNEFQDAVQKIKYLGLTGDQVNSLFSETEAELAMKSNSSDKSSLRNSLDRIKDRILLDATSKSSSSSAATSGVSVDLSGLLEFDLSSAIDLTSFLGNGLNSNNSESVSNQRGEQLYKTATARCKSTVLNSCTAQGIEANVITNAYDLEIDKHCIAYERNLNDANSEMKNNASRAAYILQQARLMLAQNKNAYGLRDCVAAIDSCMQDEYVCGSDYELCLDPSGKYLASGEIIKGGTPGTPGGIVKNTTMNTGDETWLSGGMYGLYSVWNYEDGNSKMNAFGGGAKENLGKYIDKQMSAWEKDYDSETLSSQDMALYLLQKIGYIDADDKVHGMCASVMKQCQDYTYSSSSRTNKKYLPNNEVVRQYLASTLNRIKSQQDAILADYAEDCHNDVSSCLATNGYNESSKNSTASKTAVNACRSEIQTCMSVSGYQPMDASALSVSQMSEWVATLLTDCPQNYYLSETYTAPTTNSGTTTVTGLTVTCQACPVFKYGTKTAPTESAGGQVTRCTCPDKFTDVTDNNGNLTGCIENATGYVYTESGGTEQQTGGGTVADDPAGSTVTPVVSND